MKMTKPQLEMTYCMAQYLGHKWATDIKDNIFEGMDDGSPWLDPLFIRLQTLMNGGTAEDVLYPVVDEDGFVCRYEGKLKVYYTVSSEGTLRVDFNEQMGTVMSAWIRFNGRSYLSVWHPQGVTPRSVATACELFNALVELGPPDASGVYLLVELDEQVMEQFGHLMPIKEK